jgi:hypothetical protein
LKKVKAALLNSPVSPILRAWTYTSTIRTQAKLDRWVTETGRSPEKLVEDATAGYFDELTRTREMLDSRYGDLKNGKVKPIDGEDFFEKLHNREDELLKKHSSQ